MINPTHIYRNNKGYSLIEIFMVLAIISIFLSFAIFVYRFARNKAIYVEAISNLQNIYQWEEMYRIDNDVYTDQISKLGILNKGKFYFFTISLSTDKQSFTAAAEANLDSDDVIDRWTINQEGELIHVEPYD